MKIIKVFGFILMLGNSLGYGQVNFQSVTSVTMPALVPGFSEITTINNLSMVYTPSVPQIPPTPIDGDTTTMSNGPYKYADRIPFIAQMANGNFTSTSKGKVWTLKITATNAKNIGLLVDQLNLSDSAQMFVFDNLETQFGKNGDVDPPFSEQIDPPKLTA